MTCTEFRSTFQAGTNDSALLQHLRTCDGCLDFAAHIDADAMFRALGGEEMVPPGGVDAFVADVMHAVHLKNAQATVGGRDEMSWSRKLAIAAALAVAVTGGTLVYQIERTAPHSSPGIVAHHVPKAVVQPSLTTKPVVETYSSSNATIVEMPSEGTDTQVVMIVDENLPADL